MKETTKQITVNATTYEFFLDEGLNKWRMLENSSLIDNHTVDVEIDVANASVDWKNITYFINFLTTKRHTTNESIESAQSVCKAFFKATHTATPDDVSLKLLAIYFKGNITSYFYDYLFSPQYDKYIYGNQAPVQYKASFRGITFLGVTLDTAV